jgi:hypothetical protein
LSSEQKRKNAAKISDMGVALDYLGTHI